MEDNVIVCDGLTHYYGRRCIYSDLSFNVAKGTITGLLGKSRTVKTMRQDYPQDESFNLPKYIFPARLVLSSSLDGRIRPRFVDFSWIGLCVDIIALAAAFLLAKALRKR